MRNYITTYDPFFDRFFLRANNCSVSHMMKTDIKETDTKYIIEMDLPGFDKQNINLTLNDGYLEISAKQEREENSEDGAKYVRKERFYGECSRSFYVGDNMKEEDIDAEFKNGILVINVPKKTESEEKVTRQIEIK